MDFDQLPARSGQKMDLLIAETILGHSIVKRKQGGYTEGTDRGTRPLPSYSKDISAAWEVAEKIGITLIPVDQGSWFAMAGTNGQRWKSPGEFIQYLQTGEFASAGAAVADSAPLAICLAALSAVKKKESA